MTPPPRSAPPRTEPPSRAAGAWTLPPLLPVLLPILIAALVTGLLFAWWFPPAPAGGTVPAARFTDVTAAAGLAFTPAKAGATDAPTTLGGGVVVFDYDGDGRPDLLFVNGTAWPWEETLAKRTSRGSLVLFHNDGNGHFTDVTAAAGLDVDLQGMTAAAGDFDNDGRPDIFVTCVGGDHLFRNRGHGRFEDVTEQAGVGGDGRMWSTGATWIDYDGDGRLDLVVCHYARWPEGVELATAFGVAAMGRSYGTPTGFVATFPSVYRNLGDGRFALVPDGAGLRDVDPQTGFPVGQALAVVPVDANGDGQLDLIFTYLRSEAALFLNEGHGRFRRWQPAVDRRQEGAASALVAGAPLALTQPAGTDERFAALQAVLAGQARGGGVDTDLDRKLGVAVLDYDLDGRLDVFSGNGRAEPDTNRFERGRALAAAPELRWNRGGTWVVAPRASTGAGGWWAQPLVARGVAVADFDGDGDLDVVIAQNGAGPRLLRNDQRLGAPWLEIDLVASHGVRAAYGARVEVYTPHRVLVRTMVPAMGLMAQSASTLTFGLGEDARVRKIVVFWPDGVRQELRSDGVNRRLVITEP